MNFQCNMIIMRMKFLIIQIKTLNFLIAKKKLNENVHNRIAKTSSKSETRKGLNCSDDDNKDEINQPERKSIFLPSDTSLSETDNNVCDQ